MSWPPGARSYSSPELRNGLALPISPFGLLVSGAQWLSPEGDAGATGLVSLIQEEIVDVLYR